MPGTAEPGNLDAYHAAPRHLRARACRRQRRGLRGGVPASPYMCPWRFLEMPELCLPCAKGEAASPEEYTVQAGSCLGITMCLCVCARMCVCAHMHGPGPGLGCDGRPSASSLWLRAQPGHPYPQPMPLVAWQEGGLLSGLCFLLPRGRLSESELTLLNLTPQPCSPLQR